MAKACVIVVWFGKLPEYYRFWELSCGRNAGVADFLLVTDQPHTPAVPNLRVQQCTMEQLRQQISEKLGIEASFEKPFKSCDFRPAYGVIFEQELAGYEYWGHCDLDQVFGDLRILIDRPDLEQYDKIGRSGHLTLYRNCPEMNGLYRQAGALYDWETVFTTPANYAFDERTGICRIAREQGTRYLNTCDLRADIRVRTRRLEINAAKNYVNQLFYWEDGHLYRAYLDGNQIRTEEFIYIHFQKKQLADRCEGVSNAFFIGREGFFPKTGDVTGADFDRYNRPDSGLRQRLDTVKYFWKKTMDYFRSNKAQRKVWMSQKRIGKERYD
ncbi:MAG: hypothetical protein E7466_03390 [Ruminococcaceae bacterium]|nr:hypothetical protein [Oscillospiraceae bacterium]